MEEDEDVVFIPPAHIEVDYIHYSVSLLEQIQSLVILFALYKLDCVIIQLGQYYWYFIL